MQDVENLPFQRSMSLFHTRLNFSNDFGMLIREVLLFSGIVGQIVELNLTRPVLPFFPTPQNTLPLAHTHGFVVILALGMLKVEILVLFLLFAQKFR